MCTAVVGIIFLILCACSPSFPEWDRPDDRIQVLLLTDRDGHGPALRPAEIMPHMHSRAIDLFFTDELTDLNTRHLSRFHVVVQYGHPGTPTRSQEGALNAFHHAGGGVVLLENSSALPPVVEIRSRGEDLAIRLEGEESATRWSEETFVAELELAIRRAAGERAMDLPHRPFPFEFSMEVIPSHDPEVPEEEERNPRPMQQALLPEESMERFVVQPGFRVELFASEPDIVNPISIQWDERGRLWVLETTDYPNELRDEPTEGKDRILILEDTNGDGRANDITVFAEGLNIPTAMAFARGGVVVHQAPQTLFLKDTNGDGRADQREVLFDGWGIWDTHAGPSNITYGFDNWIWGVLGYSGFDGVIGGRSHLFSMGVYRFRPDGSELEYLKSTDNNTWGFGFNELGMSFGSTANRNPVWYLPIPGRYYEAVRGWSTLLEYIPDHRGWASVRLRTIADDTRIYPVTERIRQGDHYGHYSSGAGFAVYSGRNYPESYWNRMAFLGDPTVQVVGQFALEPEGTDYRALNKWNLIASDDEWFAPVDVKMGPDGNLWVADWYNFIPQHNTAGPWPRGAGNAFFTDLRDYGHGRIYRIVHDEAPEQEPMDLSNATPEQLLAALNHENHFWRITAQRLLVDRGQTNVADGLYRLLRNRSTDAIGLNPGALHALGVLQGIGLLEVPDPDALDAVIEALEHPSMAVRRKAVSLLPPTESSLQAIFDNNMLHDSEPHVRLTTLLTVSGMPLSDRVGGEVWNLLKDPENVSDRWIPDGVTAAGARNDVAFLQAAFSDGSPPLEEGSLTPSVAQALRVVSTHYARIGPSGSVFSMLSEATESHAAVREVFLSSLATQWPAGQVPPLNEEEREQLDQLGELAEEEQIAGFSDLLSRWYDSESRPASRDREEEDASGIHNEMTIITDGDVMEFDVTEIRAPAGSRLTITYVNRGTSPTMTHNVVFVWTREDVLTVGQAALVAQANDYIPPGEMDRIIAYTPLAPPGETVEVTFTVPPPGIYPYICTFGGHYMAMQGVLISE